MVSRITAAEREVLRLFDALIDAEPMTHDDFKQIEFDDELCFPSLAKKREHYATKYARQKADKMSAGTWEQEQAKQKEYYEANRERIRARKAAYYQANKERISAAQKDYRQRRALSLAVAIA